MQTWVDGLKFIILVMRYIREVELSDEVVSLLLRWVYCRYGIDQGLWTGTGNDHVADHVGIELIALDNFCSDQ